MGKSSETQPIRANREGAESTQAKIQTRDLSREIEGEAVVDSVSVSVEEGEFLGVVGPSGAGKSSLLRLFNRLDEPTRGTVLVDGVDYREIPPRELRRRVGLVLQSPALVEGTVYDNVTMGRRLRDEEFDDEEVGSLLERVGLEGYSEREVSNLSGGEAQRVSIARTVFNKPEVILLDEPTSSLDSRAEEAVEEVVLRLRETEGMTGVVVTHDKSQARRLCDTAVRLRDGRVTRSGSVEEVIET
ncbi:MAG: ATP-binding cassette domain-containing protein [Halobacteria archaeon]|nr:ATP-binding cassette domain-containing protein [Halobacteria archaeon]